MLLHKGVDMTDVSRLHYSVDGEDIVLTQRYFSLADTLDCGQAFRWEAVAEGAYRGIAGGRCLYISQQGERLRFLNTTEEQFLGFWADYFDLYTDYGALIESFCGDATMARACAYAEGMRLLRQEPWEALCSFILSQNNNIPRIKGIIERLCTQFGEQIHGGVHAFPAPEVLAALDEADLAPIRAGFRAGYVLDAARRVASGELQIDEVAAMPFADAKTALMGIRGVGPKVAECALLYGFGRAEAFPLDVWMKRAMAHFYRDGLPDCILQNPGIAQQYLFHYVRTCPEAIPEPMRAAQG